MKTIYSYVILFGIILFPLTFLAQEDWELPMKNDLIFFEFNKNFQNKKKKLCSYFTNPQFGLDLNGKINSDLSGKGGKLLSNTNYQIIYMPLGSHCGTGVNDTIEHQLILTIKKSEVKLAGLKNSFNTVKCKVKIVFTGSSSYSVKIRGFVLTGLKPSLTKGVTNTEEYLEDAYKEFLKEKKSKSEKAFYKDVKEIFNLFATTLSDQLERAIKVGESD